MWYRVKHIFTLERVRKEVNSELTGEIKKIYYLKMHSSRKKNLWETEQFFFLGGGGLRMDKRKNNDFILS